MRSCLGEMAFIEVTHGQRWTVYTCRQNGDKCPEWLDGFGWMYCIYSLFSVKIGIPSPTAAVTCRWSSELRQAFMRRAMAKCRAWPAPTAIIGLGLNYKYDNGFCRFSLTGTWLGRRLLPGFLPWFHERDIWQFLYSMKSTQNIP